MATPASPTNLGFDIKRTASAVQPPKDDAISHEHLAKCDGTNPDLPVYVAIKGSVFDVSGNGSYAPKGAYHVFAGKDASRALGMSSTKAEDVSPDWKDLSEKEKQVLDEWYNFFSKRYSIVGKVSPPASSNL